MSNEYAIPESIRRTADKMKNRMSIENGCVVIAADEKEQLLEAAKDKIGEVFESEGDAGLDDLAIHIHNLRFHAATAKHCAEVAKQQSHK